MESKGFGENGLDLLGRDRYSYPAKDILFQCRIVPALNCLQLLFIYCLTIFSLSSLFFNPIPMENKSTN